MQFSSSSSILALALMVSSAAAAPLFALHPVAPHPVNSAIPGLESAIANSPLRTGHVARRASTLEEGDLNLVKTIPVHIPIPVHTGRITRRSSTLEDGDLDLGLVETIPVHIPIPVQNERRQLSGLVDLLEDAGLKIAGKAGKTSKTTSKDAKDAQGSTSSSCPAGHTCVTGIDSETKRSVEVEDVEKRQLSSIVDLLEDAGLSIAGKAGKASKTTSKDAKDAQGSTSSSCPAGHTCVTGIDSETKRSVEVEDVEKRQLSSIADLLEDAGLKIAGKAGKTSKTTSKDAKDAQGSTSSSCPAGHTCVTGIEGETK